MRILFFTDHFRPEPSAPAAHTYERAKIWVERGHQVTVVTNVPNFPDGEAYAGYRNRRTVEMIDGIRVVRVRTFMAPNEGFALRILDYVSYMLSALLQALREPRPDVVLSTSPHLFVPIAGVLYSLMRRVPHVFEIRDLWPASILATGSMKPGLAYRFLEAIEKWLYRRSARISVLVPDFVEDLTSRGIDRDTIDVAINGANLDLFSPRDRDDALASDLGLDGRFVVGYLGTIGLAHGLDNVIDTAEALRDEPVTFLFVGAGAAVDDLAAAAEERGLDNVVFVGRRLREEMPAYWSVVDAALIHLRDDPLFVTAIPSKIFESMAVGKPILYVAPPAGGGWRIVSERDAGLCVPTASPEDLADAINRLRTEPGLAERLAENSRRAAPDYSRERQAEATLATLLLAAGE